MTKAAYADVITGICVPFVDAKRTVRTGRGPDLTTELSAHEKFNELCGFSWDR